MTALLTARNTLAGAKKFDAWAVNEDAQYHESGEVGAESQQTWQQPEVSATR
jgi:hypothetical protein